MGCRTCGADWTGGHWTLGCKECGGGALELECGLCFGTCGGRLARAVLDSNDLRQAHWVGGCALALPMQQVFARFQALAELLAAPEGRRLSDLAQASPVAEGAGPSPQLLVLRDYLSEHGLDTGVRWLQDRLSLAAARASPLAAVVRD